MGDFIKDIDSKLFEHLSKASSQVYFFYQDFRANGVRWSKSAVDYFGLPGEYLSTPDIWRSRIHTDDLDRYDEDINNVMTGVYPFHNCEYRMKNAEGDYVWINCRGYITYDENDKPSFFAGYVTNMGNVPKVDSVTSLWTSYGFRSDLRNLLEKNKDGAAIQLDILEYKVINAEYGYDFGDRVLFMIGQAIDSVFAGRAKVYRFEGAEFGVLAENKKNLSIDEMRKFLSDCYNEIRELLRDIMVNGVKLSIDVAGGAIVFPENGKFYEQISNRLSYSVSHAKHNNIKDLFFYSDEMYSLTNRAMKLREALRESIHNDFSGFRLVFQPIVSSADGKIKSAEALLRWSCDEFPNASPVEFIPVLEQTKDIIAVGKWVIDNALCYLKKWNDKLEDKLEHINVNVSYIQFMQEDFVDYVVDKIKYYGVEPSRLVLELTESCRIEFSEKLHDVLKRLSDIGIKIALDDFGTGYASLSVLKDIPTDIIKLDHTMIRTVINRPKDRSLVELIVGYSNRLDIDVCAEGVENEEVLSIVKNAGAGYIQGYYFDKPLEAEQFSKKYIKK